MKFYSSINDNLENFRLLSPLDTSDLAPGLAQPGPGPQGDLDVSGGEDWLSARDLRGPREVRSLMVTVP